MLLGIIVTMTIIVAASLIAGAMFSEGKDEGFVLLIMAILASAVVCAVYVAVSEVHFDAAKYHALHGEYPVRLVEHPDGTKSWEEIDGWRSKIKETQ